MIAGRRAWPYYWTMAVAGLLSAPLTFLTALFKHGK